MQRLARGEQEDRGPRANGGESHLSGCCERTEAQCDHACKRRSCANLAAPAHFRSITEQQRPDRAKSKRDRIGHRRSVQLGAEQTAQQSEQSERPDASDTVAGLLGAQVPAALDADQEADRERQRETGQQRVNCGA